MSTPALALGRRAASRVAKFPTSSGARREWRCAWLPRWEAGRAEEAIWSRIYFDPAWQLGFDLFNSLPLIALGLAVACWRRWPVFFFLCLSMALHVAADLPLHHEDAHRHLLPLSTWRFESPLSYWDPAHHGRLVASLEGLGVLAGSLLLLRRGRPWREVGIVALAIHAAYVAFALRVWSSP